DMPYSNVLIRGKHVGRLISICWASFWILFGFNAVLEESQGLSYSLYQTTIPGFFFLGSSIIAWMHRKVGGTILLIEGMAILVFFPVMAVRYLPPFEIFLACMLLSIPPFIASYFFLRRYRFRKF
ncbi:MAG: hypothetical protein ACE5I1_19500, partial [bacterium]